MTTISYREHAGADPRATRPLLFLAIEGARPLQGSSRHVIEGATEVVIGRKETRSVQRDGVVPAERLLIGVPDPHMSGAHARLVPDGDSWVAEDLGSKNGLFVGGKRHRRLRLADGDILRLGQTLFLFRSGLGISASAERDVDAPAMQPALATLVPSLAQRFDDLVRVVAGQLPLLLRGDTGTGKELVARSVHALSGRRGPFVAVNCGALPAHLVESELFGHKRGAFSGATADHVGLFRAANGGTLLLDEIGDLPLAGQAALLRALQEREVRPVGGTEAVRIDVRVIAATHRDLEAHVVRDLFREDLLARLNGFALQLPALRDRREDIGLLAAAILRRVANTTVSLTPAAGEAILSHGWPQNVRELETTLVRAVLLAETGVIDVEHLGLRADSGAPQGQSPLSRERMLALLEVHQGNLAAIAKELATSRSQVYRWLRRYDLDPKKSRT